MIKKLITNHWPVLLFILIYTIFNLATYKDLPIANGEEFRYLRGKETLKHFREGQFTELMVQPRPHYFLYNLYPMLLVFLNPKFFYEWFHLMNMVFSTIIFVVSYFLMYEFTRSKSWSILPVVALVLFPTFFGHMGINPIDMPFTAVYLLGLYLILKFSSNKLELWQMLLLGLVFGITQGLRQLGFTLYMILILFDLVCHKKFKIFEYITVFIIACFVMLITWPNFAINIFQSFQWYLFVGGNFYLWHYGLLFMGAFLENVQRPWFYLPLLQIITTPIYILALFVMGGAYFKKLIKNKVYVLLLSAFVINYVLYFAMKPVLYDGTRHFLHLIPIFTLMAIIHLYIFLKSNIRYLYKALIVTLIIINVSYCAYQTVKSYPYHYIFFNKIAYLFGNPYYQFESDYSSTTYKDSAEWVRDEYLKNIPEDGFIEVYACDNGYAVDYYSHKKFLTTLDREEADLIICDYKRLMRNTYPGEILHASNLQGYPITYVIKQK